MRSHVARRGGRSDGRCLGRSAGRSRRRKGRSGLCPRRRGRSSIHAKYCRSRLLLRRVCLCSGFGAVIRDPKQTGSGHPKLNVSARSIARAVICGPNLSLERPSSGESWSALDVWLLPTGCPMERPPARRIAQPIDRLIAIPTAPPPDRAPAGPTDGRFDLPTGRSSDGRTDRPAGRSSARPTGRRILRPWDRPTRRPAAGLIGRPSDRPAGRPTDQPCDLLTEPFGRLAEQTPQTLGPRRLLVARKCIDRTGQQAAPIPAHHTHAHVPACPPDRTRAPRKRAQARAPGRRSRAPSATRPLRGGDHLGSQGFWSR